MTQLLYKVLTADMQSPFQEFPYELEREYICEDFDPNPERDCSRGFYATAIDGLPYAWNIHRKAFEVKVAGRSVEIDQFKRRYEKITLLREVPVDELVTEAQAVEDQVGYRLSEVIQPINPRDISPPETITAQHRTLLKQWASVRASVGASVGASVWDSVWDSVGASVGDSVGNSVGDSVWDSVGAYIGALFPNISEWKYIDHPVGEYPFQPAVDLWRQGLVPSYDGRDGTWRLHGGSAMDVLYAEQR